MTQSSKKSDRPDHAGSGIDKPDPKTLVEKLGDVLVPRKDGTKPPAADAGPEPVT